jgi:hypothetical protein
MRHQKSSLKSLLLRPRKLTHLLSSPEFLPSALRGQVPPSSPFILHPSSFLRPPSSFLLPLTSLLLLLTLLIAHPAFANVDLLYFRAESSTTHITLVWETETELDNLGFYLWRSQTGNQNDATRLNASIIPSQVGGQPIGALYEYTDSNVTDGIVYSYWLESVDMNGSTEFHGPTQAALGGGSPIITPVPGGGGDTPIPPNTPTPRPSTTATNQPAATGSAPTATRPNPTATTASILANPTAVASPITSVSATTNTAPAVPSPTNDSRPTDSAPAVDPDQPEANEPSPQTLAVTPTTATETQSIAGNDPNAPKATATFIAGESLVAIGEQNPSADAANDTSPAVETEPATNLRQRGALILLIIGALLTAIGGFALWNIGRHRVNPHD